MMFDYQDQLEFGIERYREMVNESERLRPWAGKGWRASKAIETVRQAFERLGRLYARYGELCLNLEPACEMPYA